jgi:cell division protein ZapA (FtsZ GTPase activity inhibitor)
MQLNQIMNDVTSESKTQQLHDEIVVFEIFISHDYFEALKKYAHIDASFIRHKMRKALNEYLTILMNSEIDEHASCRSFSTLSNDLVSA